LERLDEKVRVRVVISGKVQGVFFRGEVARRARRLKVRGWVRNLYDGRVEAVFEGEKGSVEEIVGFCRKGPPHARVDNVNVEYAPFKAEFHDFQIKYTY